MSAVPADLLMMLLGDARLPVAGHTQSATLEGGVQAGLTAAEVPLYIAARLSTSVRVEAGTAVGLGDVGVHQPDLPGLVDHVLGPGAVLVQLPGDVAHVFLGEAVGQLLQVLLFVGQGEVNHRLKLLLVAKRSRLTGQSTNKSVPDTLCPWDL